MTSFNRVTDKKSILPELLRSPNTSYPYFDTAVWLDSSGMQKAKWTVKNETTQYINVSGRAYFNSIRQGNYRELQGHRFWLEPIVSKTTGRNEVEMSQLAGGHWAGLMSQFFKEYGEDTGDHQGFCVVVEKEKERIKAQDLEGKSMEDVTKLINIVYTECAPKLPLQNIGLHILRQKHFVTLTPDHLLNRIMNQAKTYYEDIWDTCSLDEKLTLFHLAQDRLLSHRDPDIERLLRRELIVRDVDVHLMNESFRHFVKSTEQVAFVAEHEQKAKQRSLWHTLKVPLLVVLVSHRDLSVCDPARSLHFFVGDRDGRHHNYSCILQGAHSVPK